MSAARVGRYSEERRRLTDSYIESLSSYVNTELVCCEARSQGVVGEGSAARVFPRVQSGGPSRHAKGVMDEASSRWVGTGSMADEAMSFCGCAGNIAPRLANVKRGQLLAKIPHATGVTAIPQIPSNNDKEFRM
jgi:hypothetical protein